MLKILNRIGSSMDGGIVKIIEIFLTLLQQIATSLNRP